MRYDPESRTRLSTAIVYEIADASGDDPTSIEPLFHSVDPEMLDRLVVDGYADGSALAFTFHGYAVTVTVDGEVTFEPAEE